jgi:hypothetical protein
LTKLAPPLPSTQLRYANNSNYKNDTMIRKESFVSQAVLDELKRIITDSEVSAGAARGLVAASGGHQGPSRGDAPRSSSPHGPAVSATHLGRGTAAAASAPNTRLMPPHTHAHTHTAAHTQLHTHTATRAPHTLAHTLPLPLSLPRQILKEDDANWPAPDRVGRQELEVVLGGEHISFATTKLGSLLQVQGSKDPEGLRVFYYLVQVSSSAHCLVGRTVDGLGGGWDWRRGARAASRSAAAQRARPRAA